jgi:ribosome-binding factor A
MKSINLKKTESLLLELITEALSEFEDNLINTITITEVNCKNGKYDAKVYFDATDFDKQEQQQIINHLKKVKGQIKSYCLIRTSWYKCPNFTFIADESLSEQQRLEELFKQI